MSIGFPRFRTMVRAALAAAGVLLATAALPDAGHDHGAPAPKAASPGAPRFTASSELFEIVGVVSGKHLALYLDRSDDNSPVKAAKLELELGGRALDIRARADGEYEATLPQALQPGTIAVTATITAGQETDLLAGELIVAQDQPPESQPSSRRLVVLIAGSTAGVLAVLAALAGIARRARSRRPGMPGVAA